MAYSYDEIGDSTSSTEPFGSQNSHIQATLSNGKDLVVFANIVNARYEILINRGEKGSWGTAQTLWADTGGSNDGVLEVHENHCRGSA